MIHFSYFTLGRFKWKAHAPSHSYMHFACSFEIEDISPPLSLTMFTSPLNALTLILPPEIYAGILGPMPYWLDARLIAASRGTMPFDAAYKLVSLISMLASRYRDSCMRQRAHITFFESFRRKINFVLHFINFNVLTNTWHILKRFHAAPYAPPIDFYISLHICAPRFLPHLLAARVMRRKIRCSSRFRFSIAENCSKYRQYIHARLLFKTDCHARRVDLMQPSTFSAFSPILLFTAA